MAIDINHSLGKITVNDQDLILETTGTETNINVSSKRVTNVQDPVNSQDAVTKSYLEAAIAGLSGNVGNILDKLTPQSPPTINTKPISIIGTGAYRITDFPQTDNTNSGLSASAGSTVQYVLRNNDYVTSTITQVGPGDSTTLEVYRNGVITASKEFTDGIDNGTYTDTDSLVISNNVDYGTITGDALGFWQSYDTNAIGVNTVPEGWNNIKFVQGTNETNTVVWYSDQSNPGTPEITNISVTPNPVENIVYSSTVPHYTNQQVFDVTFDVNKLSGDFYPSTDTFFDATAFTPATSGINALSDLTYQQVGITTPLPRNYLVSSGSYTVSTSTTVKSGTGISVAGAGPSATINNSYSTATATFAVSNKIIYIYDDITVGSPIDETKIIVSNVGFGSGDAYRVETLNGDTPSESNIYTAFNGQNSILNSYDATIVGGIVSHDTNNYSTGYYPAGPDLSIGRSDPQYIQFEFKRLAASKFKIVHSGKVSGCWVRLPGSSIDSTSGMNGWLDTSLPYEGVGVPGSNTSNGGNGSNGCGLSSVMPLNTLVSNNNTIITFGTESSSNATNNSIIVRFKLSAGDTMSFLKFMTAE